MTTTRRETTAHADFGQGYTPLLREYASGAGESALGQAYERARLAISEQTSLMEIASVHHQALKELMRDLDLHDEKRRADLLRASGDFLAEFLSPYEVSHRGFQDAVTALRQLNETLEEEIKRQLDLEEYSPNFIRWAKKFLGDMFEETI